MLLEEFSLIVEIVSFYKLSILFFFSFFRGHFALHLITKRIADISVNIILLHLSTFASER